MKHILLKIFIFLVICVSANAQFFENVEVKINQIFSCSKQAQITIMFENTYSGFFKIQDSLTIKWKKAGNTIFETNKLYYYAIEIGSYSCEVWYNGLVIKSNIIEVDFKNDILQIRPTSYIGTVSICQIETFKLENLTDARFYSIQNNSLSLSDPKYHWFIDNVLQTNQNQKLDIVSDKNKIRLKLLIKDGSCNFISEERTIQLKNYIENRFEDKYEYCDGEETNIRPPFNENIVTGNGTGVYDWYKDGKLFASKRADFNASFFDINLKTKESGLYHLVSKINVKYPNDYICESISDTFEVAFSKKPLIKSDQYLKSLCPTDPQLRLKLSKTNYEKIEWYYNETLIPIAEYGNSANKDSTSITMRNSGQYYAKIYYPNECVSESEVEVFDGSNDFNLGKFDNYSVEKNNKEKPFCNLEYLKAVNFYEQNKLALNYTWSLNGKVIQNPNSNYLYPLISGNYQLTIRDSGGDCTLFSKPIDVIVPNKNVSLSSLDSANICVGSNLSVLIANPNAKLIHWFERNNPVSNSETLNIKEIGTYQALFNFKDCSTDYYLSKSLKVNEIQKPTASISGSKSIDYNQPTDLKFELTSAPPWQIKLNTGEEFSINESPYTLKVRPLSDMKYSINSVENICGLGNTSGEAVIKVTILAYEKSPEENANLRVFPIPVTDAFELEILDSNEKNAQIILLNNLGVELQNYLTKSINNKISKSLNINNLPAGIYNLKVKVGKKNYTRKIVKQ